jgi:hypothetical protein
VSNSAAGGIATVPTSMETFSGLFVDTLSPDPSQICAIDIAHHLATMNRYGGAPRVPLSIAAHSLLVADLLRHQAQPLRVQLAGLLHDAAEAYLHDIISPLKLALRMEEARCRGVIGQLDGFQSAYSRLTAKMDETIGAALDVDHALFDAPAVKVADLWALRVEAERYTHTGGANWRWPSELPEDGRLPDGVQLAFEEPWQTVRDRWYQRFLRLRLAVGS